MTKTIADFFVEFFGTSEIEFNAGGTTHVIDVHKVPDSILLRGMAFGLQTKARNFGASAVAIAYAEAHPDSDGNESPVQRDGWAKANPAPVNEQRDSLIAEGIARLEAGEWAAPRAASAKPRLTPQEEELYDIAKEMRDKPALKPVLKAWDATTGEPTAKRKRAVLDAIGKLDAAVQEKLNAAAAARVAATASIDI